jgi:chemotaxis protein methyltransferase CheR
MVEAQQLPAPLFALLAGLVEERAGIHYTERDRELFAGKLLARAAEAGFASALDYYYFLRYDDPDRREFDALVEMLTVHETYFFREADQLTILCDQVLCARASTSARSADGSSQGAPVRVWCAAAATGEEPLTLAMLLDERGVLGDVEIVASDISNRALSRAREGRYAGRSLRAVEGRGITRWLEPVGEAMTPRAPLRQAVTYQRLNLVDAAAVSALGTFDAIVCRNVLIYFSDDAVRGVIAAMVAALRPGGVILVGASESLLRFGTMLACEERGGAFFYRKAEA